MYNRQSQRERNREREMDGERDREQVSDPNFRHSCLASDCGEGVYGDPA